MSSPPTDDALVRHLLQAGMASDAQIAEARTLQAAEPDLPLADALVRLNVITPAQRETVEKKLGELRTQQLGPYRLRRKLGEGGMGAVYLAEHVEDGRPFAVKVLPKVHAANKELLSRFQREAEAAAILDHENIARAFCAGESRGYHYYVMEFCEGESLKARLLREKRLPEDEATRLVVQVARGLRYAHGQGFIHRDIKPDNVVVTKAGVAKILDLGLSKNLDDAERSFRTVTGAAIGTPHYISPEQARGDRDVDGRTDLYSLGATFYHLLTGQPPFHGTSVFEIVNKHLHEQLPDPRDVCDGISEGAVHVLRRMMAKNRDDRYRDAEELLGDLARVLERVTPVTPLLDAGRSTIGARRGRILGSAAPPGPRKTWIAAAIAASAVLLVVLAWPSTRVTEPAPIPKEQPVAAAPPAETPAPPAVEAPKPEPPKPEVRPEPEPEPQPAPQPVETKPEPEPTTPVPEPEPPIEPAKPVEPPPRPAAPDEKSLAVAEKTIRERHPKAFERRPTPETVRLLVEAEPEAEAALRFARLRLAWRVAARTGDPATALRALELAERGFALDALAARIEIVTEAAPPATVDRRRALVDLCLRVYEEGIAADRYRELAALTTKADKLAKESQAQDLAEFIRRATALHKEFTAVAAALVQLERSPDDPEANLKVGSFYALAKAHWAKGLPMLARGSNEDLRELAQLERDGAKEAEDGLRLCQGWLSLAEKERSNLLRRSNVTVHARGIFDRIREQLLEKPRTEIEARLAKLEKDTAAKDGIRTVDLMRFVVADALSQAPWQSQLIGGRPALVSPIGAGSTGSAELGPARFVIAYAPPEEYDLLIDLERRRSMSDTFDFVLGLVRSGARFAVALDGWWVERAAGICARSTGWQRHGNARNVLAEGRRHAVRCEVRRAGWRVLVDEAAVLSGTDYAALDIHRNMHGRPDEGFIAGTVRCEYVVYSLVLREVSGRGRPLR